MGHTMPPASVLSQVYVWLNDDLKRRREDAKAYPELAVTADDTPTPDKAATHQEEAGEAELKKAGRVWRGAALLRGVVERWPNTDAADRAQRLLKDIVSDEATARAIAEEGGKDQSEVLTAQAKALERFGENRAARQAWRILASAQPDTPAGRKAAEEAKRLAEMLAATPYLGLGFEPNSAKVTAVAQRGPADKAGLTAGDELLKIGGVSVATQEQVRQALGKHKPGDRIDLELKRAGKVTKLSVELGSAPADE
jgi:hypothetical protein